MNVQELFENLGEILHDRPELAESEPIMEVASYGQIVRDPVGDVRIQEMNGRPQVILSESGW